MDMFPKQHQNNYLDEFLQELPVDLIEELPKELLVKFSKNLLGKCRRGFKEMFRNFKKNV